MRSFGIILAILAGATLPAMAAKPTTVEQLRTTLTTAHSEHRSDDAQAHQLLEVKLTARVSGAELQQLIADSPGPKTTQAIHAIADESAFLDPPPSELPGTPPPDLAVQKAIMGRTINYVLHTMPTLPNLLATRVTEHYVDT